MTMSPRGRRLLAAALVLALGVSGISLGVAAAAGSSRPPASAAEQQLRLPARTAVAPARLDPRLASLASASNRRVTALAKTAGVTVAAGKAVVVVQAAPGGRAAALAAIRAVGGTVSGSAADLVRASVPTPKLAALAASRGVLQVRPPRRPYKVATPVSEGVHITAADRWRAKYDGSGMRVGIIDVGFKDYDVYEGSVLPSATGITTQVFDSTGAGLLIDGSAPAKAIGPEPHGTAVAEIVHDVAPGAHLYLAAIYDEVDLAAAKQWMLDNDVQVVNMSLGWIGSPLDGGNTPGADSDVNQQVSEAVQGGIFWANAAGNFRLNHWAGNFFDRDGDLALNWDGYKANLNVFQYDGNEPIEGILWWRDSWTKALNDYDLVLLHYDDALRTYQVVNLDGQGESPQWGRTGDQPFEDVYTDSQSPGYYAWAIVNMRPWAQNATSQHRYLPANAKDVDFDFFCPNQDLQIIQPRRSIMTPADNESAGFMAVGAISANWSLGGPFGYPGFGNQEPYSSEGPNQRGALSPEVMAPDDVSSQVALDNAAMFGSTFAGTSASSPHLAGVAALVRQAFPSLQPPQVEQYIKNNAIDLLSPGRDPVSGYGALQLPDLKAPAVSVSRLAGADRYRTALAVSKTWPSGSAHSVVLASGATFPDALAGSALAGGLHSPLLLTPPTGTFPELIAELHRLGATTVHILGSTAAVGPAVDAQLRANGFKVVRHAGATRYETASDIATASLALRSADTVFIVNGNNFADALSAAPVAYSQGFPVLPVQQYGIPAAVRQVVQGHPNIKHAWIVGSDLVVGPNVVSQLIGMGLTIGRSQGADRYGTAKALVDDAAGHGWSTFKHFGIASGANFPDALAGAAEAGRANGLILLTTPDVLHALARGEITSHEASLTALRVYGGEPAVQGSVLLGAKVLAGH